MMRTDLVRRTALALSLALAVTAAGDAHAGPRDNRPLELQTLDGRKVTLQDLEGSVVVLNFWATWCKPCVTEMPVLMKLAERYGRRGLRVIAANVDEGGDRDVLEQFQQKLPEGMEVWVAGEEAMQRMAVQALPTTVVLDRRGERAQMHHGALGEGQLDELLEKLLGSDAPRRKPRGARAPDVSEAKSGSALESAHPRT